MLDFVNVGVGEIRSNVSHHGGEEQGGGFSMYSKRESIV